ncbi:uncharacterized protein LOC143827891 isoform X1 [Paroedura picta]|uniref:uncharacterized protein LOC143827891 isoform X1 n=1 Tax=Paroedura picta TaxID=143630 RepID=UPI0040572415
MPGDGGAALRRPSQPPLAPRSPPPCLPPASSCLPPPPLACLSLCCSQTALGREGGGGEGGGREIGAPQPERPRADRRGAPDAAAPAHWPAGPSEGPPPAPPGHAPGHAQAPLPFVVERRTIKRAPKRDPPSCDPCGPRRGPPEAGAAGKPGPEAVQCSFGGASLGGGEDLLPPEEPPHPSQARFLCCGRRKRVPGLRRLEPTNFTRRGRGFAGLPRPDWQSRGPGPASRRGFSGHARGTHLFHIKADEMHASPSQALGGGAGGRPLARGGAAAAAEEEIAVAAPSSLRAEAASAFGSHVPGWLGRGGPPLTREREAGSRKHPGNS